MLTNSQKEHLTYTAVGQVFTVVMLSLFAYQYIFPGLTKLEALEISTQATIDEYRNTLVNGMSFDKLSAVLQGKPERAELVKIIQSDPTEANRLITKPATETANYVDWLRGEIGDSEEDRAILRLEKAKLNSIIPTMSPLSNNIEEDNVTLRQYVKFIENDILRQFNFDSNVVIGMQGIRFGDPGSSTPENLGMFEFRLDFKGTNADITKFIDYINNAGKPDILSFTGVMNMNQLPAVMSNPLITIESFAIQDKLDSLNPNKQNSGRVTLRFYVRGVSEDDIGFLKENLRAREANLKNTVSENIKLCEKDPIICTSYSRRLLSFEQKYMEYERARNTTPILLTGNDEIYALSQAVSTLRSLEKELESILPKKTK